MTITRAGTAVLEILNREGRTAVMWGDADVLDEAFVAAGLRVRISHPLNKWQAVLNGLDRDVRFEKRYNPVEVGPYYQTRLVRCFVIAKCVTIYAGDKIPVTWNPQTREITRWRQLPAEAPTYDCEDEE